MREREIGRDIFGAQCDDVAGVYEIRVSPGYLQFAPDTEAERGGHCMGNG